MNSSMPNFDDPLWFDRPRYDCVVMVYICFDLFPGTFNASRWFDGTAHGMAYFDCDGNIMDLESDGEKCVVGALREPLIQGLAKIEDLVGTLSPNMLAALLEDALKYRFIRSSLADVVLMIDKYCRKTMFYNNGKGCGNSQYTELYTETLEEKPHELDWRYLSIEVGHSLMGILGDLGEIIENATAVHGRKGSRKFIKRG